MVNKATPISSEILEALRKILTELPGWSKIKMSESHVNTVDCLVTASVRGQQVRFALDAKAGGWRPEALNKAKKRLGSSDTPLVIGAAWIPSKLAATLREMGLNYLDTAGNAYLDLPGLQVFRETNASPLVDPSRKRPVGDVFNPSAIRVGLQLLLDPSLVGTNLRHLAALAGVSAPSAKFAMDAFKDDGYVLDAGKKGRRLVEREGFFRKWAESYSLRYLPRHGLGTFTPGESEIRLDAPLGCWGGESASDRILHNLKPQTQMIHVYGAKIAPLVAKNKLRSDPEGTVTLIQAFWNPDQEGPHRTAPPFVVFADLMSLRDPRCTEAAEQLFETVIKRRLDDGK